MNKAWSYKWASIILITMISTFFFVQITNAAVPEGHDFTSIPVGADYAPGELLVRFAPKAKGIQRNTEEKYQILSSLGGGTIERNYTIVPGLTLVKLPTGLTVKDALKTFNKIDGILYAEPNYRVKAFSAIFPNDPYGPKAAPDGGKQWHLNNIGQDPPGGSADADINAPEGWDISTGSSEIIVAVIDTGVDYEHEDLAANMWTNEAELNGAPNVDDDDNGYVDDIYGYDFCNYDADPIDDEGHGTACAGIVGAVGNNGVGVTGVCWNVKIMAMKFLDEGGSGWTDDAILCVQYGNLMGARVMSNSWGGGGYSSTLEDAIKAAKANGVVFIAASGNYGPPGGPVAYPAKYAEAVAVGATDEDDEIWDYSGHGDELDVVAPSGLTNLQGNIWTTDITGATGYNNRDPSILDYTDKMGGTSAATPQVAGLAGLILSVNPGLTSDQVQFIMESTAEDEIGDPSEDTEGWDQYYGWGRINVDRALKRTTSYSLFRIRNSAGEPAADFDQFGNLFLKGRLSTVAAGPGQGIEGHWELDKEGSWEIAFDSVGSNDGSLVNMEEADWVQGKMGRALKFDGFNERVSLSAIQALEGDAVTISAWAKLENDPASYAPIVTQYDVGLEGYDLCLWDSEDSGKPCFLLDNTSAQASDALSLDEWHHLAGTYDSQELRIYVDGVLKASELYADESGWDTGAYFGYGVWGTTYFEGIIDDVRVYNYAMSLGEIRELLPDISRFRIENSLGETVASFDSSGYVLLKGSEQETWQDPSAASDDFIITNSEDEPMAYINDSGDLYLKGKLYQQEP